MTPMNPDNSGSSPTGSSRDRSDLWVFPVCAQCGERDGESLLAIPQPDAPGGVAHVWKCSKCGLRRLSPRPGPEIIGYYYARETGYNAFDGRRRSPRVQAVWDFLRDTFSAPANASLPTRLAAPIGRLVAQWAFDINVFIGGRTGLRVLEVGSGYGDLLIYLRSRGCQVLGTDLSPAAASKAREIGVDVRVGELTELSLPAESVDAGVMCHSLEHVPDPNAELRELHRLLVPGGLLHIAVPNGEATRLLTDGVQWTHLSHPYHFWYFGPEDLVKLVRKHGFEPEGSPVTTTRHHALNQWLHEFRTLGPIAATHRFFRFLTTSLNNRDGGDVLRLVCRRK
jgi:SAM-dependent methyltransferase